MKNMKIKTKLVTGFLLLALLTAIVGGIGIYSLRVTANETQLLNERATMAILSVRLARNVNQQRAAYLGVVAFDEIEEYADAERYKESLSSLADDFDGLVYDLESMLTVDEAKQRLSDIKTVYADYVIKREELMAIMDDVSARRLAMTNDDPSESLKSVDRIRQDVGSALLSVGDTAGVLVENVVSLTDFIESVADKQAADVEATAEKVTIISVIILVIAVAIAILLGLYISSVISKPVNLMMGFLRQVGETGNLTFSEEALGNMRESMKYRDETSQSLAAFVRMLEHLIRCGTALQSVAAHDLTVRVETLGVSDTIGNALTTMVSNLNDMFDEINVASSQVSGGSQQIANGAQSLAQGASEQAASVE
ncbi:MAG: methyl-accepting chemotaxis protein, partial [Clostridiales Family XIII bacterium]|nr:methyl-accepting chemotaxis protein [Clostridiales Family XIII bacterium]